MRTGQSARSLGKSILRKGTQIPVKVVESMIEKGGKIGQVGQYLRTGGSVVGKGAGAALKIAGPVLYGVGTITGAMKVNKLHKYRNQLKEIAEKYPDDKQVQEFFKINDAATKRNDAYFGVNTALGAAGAVGATAAGVSSVAGALGAAGLAEGAGVVAGAMSGPIGWAILGIGAATALFTHLFEKSKQKKAYRNYLTKLYGSADHPSLHYYLEHKDPGLLKEIDKINNYIPPENAPEQFKTYIQNVKHDIKAAQEDVKIQMNVSDPRYEKLRSIIPDTDALNNTAQIMLNNENYETVKGKEITKFTTEQIHNMNVNEGIKQREIENLTGNHFEEQPQYEYQITQTYGGGVPTENMINQFEENEIEDYDS
jgi:hypothetical protein